MENLESILSMIDISVQPFEKELEKVFMKLTSSKAIHESSLHVENTSGDFSWNMGYGGRTVDSAMILSSVSKLFTTTCILKLKEQSKLSFEDNLVEYFSRDVLKDIHIYEGTDYSFRLTVGNLLFMNTGFPDTYAAGRNCLDKQLIKADMYVPFDEYVKITKNHKKKFAPGTAGKAHYSDMNFEMLGKIIEKIEESNLHDVYKKYVFTPLNLKKTYMPESDNDFIPKAYYKKEPLYRPKWIRSLPACGGCISTSAETMRFIKAFFGGELFDRSVFNELRKFSPIQYSPHLTQYGGGFVRLNISGIASMYRLRGELIGHMGASGAFAYYYPDKDLYFVGDVNQLSYYGKMKLFSLPVELASLAVKYM